MDHVLRRDDYCQSCDETKAGCRTGKFSVRVDENSARGRRKLVSEARSSGYRRRRSPSRVESHLLVNMLDLRLPSGLFFLLVGAALMAVGIMVPEYRAP